jgi:hypothetical protein
MPAPVSHAPAPAGRGCRPLTSTACAWALAYWKPGPWSPGDGPPGCGRRIGSAAPGPRSLGRWPLRPLPGPLRPKFRLQLETWPETRANAGPWFANRGPWPLGRWPWLPARCCLVPAAWALGRAAWCARPGAWTPAPGRDPPPDRPHAVARFSVFAILDPCAERGGLGPISHRKCCSKKFSGYFCFFDVSRETLLPKVPLSMQNRFGINFFVFLNEMDCTCIQVAQKR